MIDIDTEKQIPLSEVARRLNVDLSTVHRWAKGLNDGPRLESIRIGGHRRTSEEALQRFIADQNPDQPAGKTRTASHRKKATRKALAFLKSEGVVK